MAAPVDQRQRAAQRAKEAETLKEKQRFVKGYLQVIQNLYKRGHFTQEQAKLADIAFEKRLPPSAFVSLVRKQDPQYPRTQEFRERRAEAKDVWQRVRPGRPMPQDFSANYIHSSLKKQQLIEKVEQSRTAQRAGTPRVSNDPRAYLEFRRMMNEAYRTQTGFDAPPDLHRMVFSSRVKDEEREAMLPNLFGGSEVFNWMSTPARKRQDLMRESLKPKTSSAPSVFLDQSMNQFGIGVDDVSSGLVSSEFIK